MTGSLRSRWAAGLAVGLLVLVLAVVELNWTAPETGHPYDIYVFLLLLAVAIGALPLSPATSLTAAWGAGLVQLLDRMPPLFTECALVAVVFVCARWGRVVTLVAAGASAVVVPLLVFAGLGSRSWFYQESPLAELLLSSSYRMGWRFFGLLALSVLPLAWVAGLALRFLARAGTERNARAEAEHELEQTQEIARLRDEQARLARDVHDVVGHSLAVILAQAESAQYLDDVDTGKLKQTMQTIATSARSSLQDVRQVLSGGSEPTARPGGLDELIEGVRRSGHQVDASEIGRPQPLPPELEVVAYRVLQEMLTNAIRHGRRGAPILLERHWPEPGGLGEQTLRIEVRNVAGSPVGEGAETMPIATAAEPAGVGQGLAGMRRRLEVAGGRLDVRRRRDGDALTFTVTAWIPVRAR